MSVPKERIRALGGAKLGIICDPKDAILSNKTIKNLAKDVYGIHSHPLLSEKTLLELGMVQFSANGEFADRNIRESKNTECNEGKSTKHERKKKSVVAMGKILCTQKKLFEGIGRFKDSNNGELTWTHVQMKPTT